MKAKAGEHVYFMGIAGTGMASIAGLAQEAGFKVSGSDQEVYPPMSTMLEELGINVRTPYAAANLERAKPDLVIVANVLSRGHVELEALLAAGIPYTSFPAFLGENFLAHRASVVVTGTHGKTTTTSLLAHLLTQLGEDPGFFVGGVPKDFPRSFHLGKGAPFLVEGDEYDTAFFDKGPKFLHYRPQHLILNNIEFDHADIYKDLAAILAEFEKVTRLVPNLRYVAANVDDPEVLGLVRRMGIEDKVTRVSTRGATRDADVVLGEVKVSSRQAVAEWEATVHTKSAGDFTFRTHLTGSHNMANICQAIAIIQNLAAAGTIRPQTNQALAKAIQSFGGVKRRLDLLFANDTMAIYEDFAHHPTAITKVIEGFRKSQPDKRLLVAFEPKNATNRRNVFTNELATALQLADRVYIGKCPKDLRIPEAERMDTAILQAKIGSKAKAFAENEDLMRDMLENLQNGDAVIFMSSSSFSGVQHRLVEIMKNRD